MLSLDISRKLAMQGDDINKYQHSYTDEELKKKDKIISTKGATGKKNILVIDGTTGQNAIHQAESFKKTVGVDGIILTKYDSQSKGGIIFSIQKKLKIPFYFIGTGEKLEHLLEFKKNEFIENIFS